MDVIVVDAAHVGHHHGMRRQFRREVAERRGRHRGVQPAQRRRPPAGWQRAIRGVGTAEHGEGLGIGSGYHDLDVGVLNL